ncbi:MAG: VWA domain-containing protein [Planctomycetota bacterium]
MAAVFLNPLALLLVPAVGAAWVVWRRRLGGWLTLASALCLAAAASRPMWPAARQRVARVYLLDVSGSMFLDLPAALDGVRRSMGELDPEDRVGLVVFAETPAEAVAPTEVRLLPDRLKPPTEMPDPAGSDLASAIRLAAHQFPAEGFGRQLVVLSDGRETSGEGAAEAALAAEAGIRLLCVPVGPMSVADARVLRLDAPSHVRVGQPFRLTVDLASTATLKAELIVARGQESVARQAVILDPDSTRRLVVTDRLARPGHHVYTARLRLADRCDANDAARAVVRAAGATRVLCLARGESPLAALVGDAEDIDVAVAQSQDFRLTRQALDAHDCLVLDNTPAGDLSDTAQQAIRDWVRDTAGGLIVLGGRQSFGPGGYLDSPVEEALPVLCDRPRPLALVVALDKSGSMAETRGDRPKIAYARDAVLGALSRLRDDDRFALLAFAAEPELRLPLAPKPPLDRVRTVLGAVEPHGGTDLAAALERALALFGPPADDQLRLVILLSDGQDERFDPAAARRRFEGARVALSVLMTGAEPDAVARLRAVAPEDFYHVTDPAALPAIFEKALVEALFREQIRQGTFPIAVRQPRVAADVEPAGPLHGYVRTIARPEAVVEWQTGDDPVLASRRFGLGRSIAFTATVGRSWDRNLLSRGDRAGLWQRAVRWAARPARTPGFDAEVRFEGDALIITVRAEADGRFRNGLSLAARVVPPKGETLRTPLPQVAPGEYRGRVRAPAEGAYSVAVVEEDQGLRVAASAARNYAPEWDAFGIRRAALEAVARHGDGQVLPDLAALRRVAPREAAAWRPLDWAFTAAALLLFLAAVARHTLARRQASL